MYLSIHAAAGVLIGSTINHSLISFIVGFISHFFLDMMPHADANIDSKGHNAKTLRRKYFNKIVALVYFEICVAVIIVAALLTNNIHLITGPIIWGVIGSILPDILQASSFLFPKNRFLKKFNDFHHLVHYSPEKNISFILGHLTQLIALIVIIKPLI
ncbi:MAG: hypothetical protein HUU49_03720 [Candidatus Buchananbacteria bacterium]|nr:hypothetical protein [Candidatus Buchananbacteria bacterium]